VRCTECEQVQKNKFRSSRANYTKLGTLEDGRPPEVILLLPHLILDTRRAAERWDSEHTTYCMLHLTVVTIVFLLSFRDFQDWRRESSTSVCDFTMLSMWINQQWVPQQR